MNTTDNTAAHAHASNVAVAIALLQAGVEPIMQVVCRDKNRLAIQSDIVGAALHGVENVCCITGDNVSAGDEPEAKRVFDLDGPQLISRGDRPRAGPLPFGRAIEPPPRLFIGAVETARWPRPSTSAPSGPRRRSRPARASCSCRSPTAPSA